MVICRVSEGVMDGLAVFWLRWLKQICFMFIAFLRLNPLLPPFNFGNEATLNYSRKLNHGEAVLLGIITASKFSFDNNLLNNQTTEHYLTTNVTNGVWIPPDGYVGVRFLDNGDIACTG